MKKCILVLAIVLSSVALFAQGVNFQELTLKEACAKAKAENKLVFIDCYTDWCGPCRLMTEEIFPMKEMGDYFNPKYICIKANAEKGEEGPAIKEKFGIKAYPTFVILNNDGNLIHMFAGGVLGLEFIDKVEESFNPELAFGELQKRYNAGERSKKLTSSYLQALQHTYTTNVGPLIEEFANSLSDDEFICEECLFLFDEHARLGSPREKFLTQHVEKFREVVGQDKVDQILNRKYEAYYCGILGKQMAATTTDVEQVNKQLEALHLTGVTSLPLYQAAVATYLTKEGGEALFEMIKKVSGDLENNDIDRFLYFTIPAVNEVWSEDQSKQIVALINKDDIRTRIINTLERQKKTSQPK